MKTPRDLSGKELIKKLSKHFNYEINRQVGSHIRLTTYLNGEHHLTIPDHNPLKIGTFNAIIADVATHHQISKQQILKIITS